MSILRNILGIKDIKKTIFYKEFSEDNRQLNDLIELSSRVKSNKKKLIDRDIALLKAGISGEKNVDYELKNSFIPMICLHDIRVVEDDYVAQLDFVVITHKYIMILETKKLNGDIYINESGDFIRSIKNKYGKVIKKEGIYSPIAQNDRHVRILREILKNNGEIKNMPVISGVVIANPKSIVNKTKASTKIKDEIFRHDQVTEVLNKKLKFYGDNEVFEDTMKSVAEFLVSNNKSIKFNYEAKYSLTDEDFIGENEEVNLEVDEVNIDNKVYEDKRNVEVEKKVIEIIVEDKAEISEVEDLRAKLKEYRTSMARSEKVKPYLIYNNDTLEEIIRVKPRNKEELMKVRGFGPVKVEKYGDGIIGIIKNMRTL